MKHKFLSTIVAGAMMVSMGSFLAVSPAFADHGGGGGEDGGRSSQAQTQVQPQAAAASNVRLADDNNRGRGSSNSGSGNSEDRGQLATSTATSTVNMNRGRNNDESENENKHNATSTPPVQNADVLNALIARLTAIVAQLEARLAALLGTTHAPVITAVAVSNVTTTSATVTWQTDGLTTSKIFVATSSPVAVTTTSTPFATDAVFATNHTLTLAGLSASTTYFFVIQAKDGGGNVSQSAETSFSTPATPVAPPALPIISAVTVTNVTSTQAQVNWQTNVLATSQVFFGATSSLDLTTATSVTDATPVLSHSLTLTGLTPSSTVFFVIQAKDALNRAVTSSQQSFITTP